MPRDWSTDLQEIHKAYQRRDTLVLYLNDDSVLRLSRGAVVRDGYTYDNKIRSVEDLRTSIDAGVDRINIDCQNVDSLLGFNLASSLRLLDYAIADYGKIYQSVRNLALIEDIPQVFRGVLANAEADEKNISFEFIVDYESLGAILASRGLGPRCWWKNQNGIECTATAVCSQTKFTCQSLKDFGGFEFFEEPASTLPGNGGNDGGGIGTGECFTGKMMVAVPEGEVSFVGLNERFKEGKKSIISVNPHTGALVEDEIEKMFISQRTGYYSLKFEHAELEVTNEHPFLVDWGKFKPADEFNRRRGDTTKTFTDRWIDSKLVGIKWHSDKTETFYCCKVKQNATLLVNNCAVHNRSQLPE